MSPKRILCVDDEPAIRRVLEMALKATLQAEVVTAASAGEALARLDAEPLPDLIILDVMMPGMDGYTLCRMLRDREKYAALPIVFLTTRSDKASHAAAKYAGGDGCLSKPFSPLTIGKELAEICGTVLR